LGKYAQLLSCQLVEKIDTNKQTGSLMVGLMQTKTDVIKQQVCDVMGGTGSLLLSLYAKLS